MPPNSGNSVYCFCDQPGKFFDLHVWETKKLIQVPTKCGQIFEDDGINQFNGRWATVYDGFKVGDPSDMDFFYRRDNPEDESGLYVRDNKLSVIYAFPGKY